jgi:hypothetical protein
MSGCLEVRSQDLSPSNYWNFVKNYICTTSATVLGRAIKSVNKCLNTLLFADDQMKMSNSDNELQISVSSKK